MISPPEWRVNLQEERSLMFDGFVVGSDGHVDLVVDVSTVCRDNMLAPRDLATKGSWARLEAVLQAWARSNPAAQNKPIVLKLIADASLRHCLTQGDLKSAERAEDDGFLEFVPYADPRVVELALSAESCALLSRDRLISYDFEMPESLRRRHWKWWYNRDDGAVAHFNLMSVPSGAYSEQMRGEDIDKYGWRDSFEEVDRYWLSCPNANCGLHGSVDVRPNFYDVEAWYNRHGSVVCFCPNCQTPLEPNEPTSNSRVVVLEAADSVDTGDIRYLLRPDSPTIVIGRRQPRGISTLLNPGDRDRLSREHLTVQIDDTGLLVTDNGSKNGSCVIAEAPDVAPRGRSWLADPANGKPLRPYTPERLGYGSVVVLAGVLIFRESRVEKPYGAVEVQSSDFKAPYSTDASDGAQ